MISDLINIFLVKYHKKRGCRFLHNGQCTKAKYHFEKSLLYGEDFESRFFYALCLMSVNKHNEAIIHFEQVVGIAPDDFVTFISLIECYLVTQNWEKAIELVNNQIEQYKENLIVQKLYKIANDPILREEYVMSKVSYFQALEDFDNKKLTSAFENIVKAIELDKTNSVYYYTAAMILLKDKKPKEEIEFYLEKAVFLSQNKVQYKKQLHFIKTRYKC